MSVDQIKIQKQIDLLINRISHNKGLRLFILVPKNQKSAEKGS